MRTIKAVFLVSLICASSLINITGSVRHNLDSTTVRIHMDRNLNYKDRNAYIESDSKLRSNLELIKPKDTVQKRQIRHGHLHKEDQSQRRIFKHDEKIPAKTGELSELTKNNHLRGIFHQKLIDELKNNIERHTTQKPRFYNSFIDHFTESPRRASIKENNKDSLFSDSSIDDDDDDFYDEYDDEDDDDEFYGDDDEEDDREEINRTNHRDLEAKHSNIDVRHHLMQYKVPETDTETDLFNDDPQHSQQDDDDEWVDSPQADASDGPASSTLKWERVPLGHSRGNKKVKKVDTREALQHVTLMGKLLSCKNPKPRVVKIQSVHPNHSKQYTPHCTVLHRCGDDTGCCQSDIATCSPKNIETVHLYFFTQAVGQESIQTERLAFENHTECECVEKRGEMMIKDDVAFLSIKPTPSWKETTEYMDTETLPPVKKKCSCPTEYSVHIMDNGECKCDCFNKQRDCMRIKRGKEYFGLKDRICIQRGHCKMPNCEFGNYNSTTGRCPKKHEMDDTIKLIKLYGK